MFEDRNISPELNEMDNSAVMNKKPAEKQNLHSSPVSGEIELGEADLEQVEGGTTGQPWLKIGPASQNDLDNGRLRQ